MPWTQDSPLDFSHGPGSKPLSRDMKSHPFGGVGLDAALGNHSMHAQMACKAMGTASIGLYLRAGCAGWLRVVS